MSCEKKYDIYFEEADVLSQFRKLLQHECSLCSEARPFHTFMDLEQHMRKQHELFCCKLCVSNLKNFTYERKWYSRKDLARHRISGDPDDTSHRGHPLCKFCDERYLDNDELLKHLRRDHYFCHFCDSDGAQEYYSDYDYLREHFREAHFLCEEGNCSTEQFTHAFRSEIDYKAHKTSCHSKNRAEARQNRQIDLQFNYASRHMRRHEGIIGGEDYDEVDRFNRPSGSGRPARGGNRGGQPNKRGSWRYKREEENPDIAAAVRASVAASRQEDRRPLEDKNARPLRRQEERKSQEDKEERTSRRQEDRRLLEDRDVRPSRINEERMPIEDKETRPSRRQEERRPPEDKDVQPLRRQEERRQLEESDEKVSTCRRQDERRVLEDKDGFKHRKNNRIDADEEWLTKKDPKPVLEVAGSNEVTKPAPQIDALNPEDFPAFGSSTVVPVQSSAKLVPAKLKEEDFPSLSAAATSSGASLISVRHPSTYTNARKASTFQEEDFPALVSKLNPFGKSASSAPTAWANSTTKKGVKPSASSSTNSKPQAKKSSTVSNSKASNKISSKVSFSDEEDDSGGMTAQEFRNTPTMMDISSLIAAPSSHTVTKVGKKKRMGSEQQCTLSSASTSNKVASNSSVKENTTKMECTSTIPANSILSDTSNKVMNGYSKRDFVEKSNVTKEPPGLKKPAVQSLCSLADEDFPALGNYVPPRMPPPGFSSVGVLASRPPPPGLPAPVSKPPPGFSNIPPVTIAPEPVVTSQKEPLFTTGVYLVPDNFQQRNIHLIQSIKEFLQSDESKFNEFKTHSGKFRQGLIDATKYYKCCRELLGENFMRIFNELLVLLPDTGKQQELLSAHHDFLIEEKQGSNKQKKNKKNVWQNNSNQLDCYTCPSCKQVLSQQDAAAHKTLHIEDDDFPSLQAISRIIS
ncbi:E3 ubiquitin-protein ligase ZNF598 isoform X2 [Ambystoma mexicanum]